jgi:hypothetical protein
LINALFHPLSGGLRLHQLVPVLSPLAGYSYEKYGFAQSYLIMGLLVFCTTFISIFLLRSGPLPIRWCRNLRYLNQKKNDDLHNSGLNRNCRHNARRSTCAGIHAITWPPARAGSTTQRSGLV